MTNGIVMGPAQQQQQQQQQQQSDESGSFANFPQPSVPALQHPSFFQNSPLNSATPKSLQAGCENNAFVEPDDNNAQQAGGRPSEDGATKEKTPMCRIAEIARNNKLKHEYKLLNETGPAHRKVFTVQLVLTADEMYEGTGASIKKASQAAAAEALKHTTFLAPTRSELVPKRKDASPMQLLNHAVRQLQISDPSYTHRVQLVPEPPPCNLPPFAPPNPHAVPFPFQPPLAMNAGLFPVPATHLGFPIDHHHQHPPQFPPGYFPQPWVKPVQQNRQSDRFLPVTAPIGPPPLPGRPPSLLSQPPLPILRPRMKKIYHVTLSMNGHSPFRATDPELLTAQTLCATQALHYLRPLLSELNDKMKSERKNRGGTVVAQPVVEQQDEKLKSESAEEDDGDEEPLCSDESPSPESGEKPTPPAQVPPKIRGRKVIQQLIEKAEFAKMKVDFEVLSEEGPAHCPRYLLRCVLRNDAGEIIVSADGEGTRKNTARQNAAALVLGKLTHLDTNPLLLAASILRAEKKRHSGVVPSKRKMIIKDAKMDPEYGQQINPVSRLIQVSQARGQEEPTFALIGETGHGRFKIYTVEAEWLEERVTGSGPNKRLAKRAAAEALLEKIGYGKKLPPPGKSLLKKRAHSLTPVASFGNDFDTTDGGGGDDGSGRSTSMDRSSVEPTPNSMETPPSQLSLASVGGGGGAAGAQSATEDEAPWTNEPLDEPSTPCTPTRHKKVTFSATVSACPAPEDMDSAQQQPLESPLKSEVVLIGAGSGAGSGRLRRKARDAKRQLTPSQRSLAQNKATEFLSAYDRSRGVAMLPADEPVTTAASHSTGFRRSSEWDSTRSAHELSAAASIGPKIDVFDLGQLLAEEAARRAPQAAAAAAAASDEQPPATPVTPISNKAPVELEPHTPRRRLEYISALLHFPVQYTHFSQSSVESSVTYYLALATLFIDKGIVAQGSALSEDDAIQDAALDALRLLAHPTPNRSASAGD